MSVLKERDMLKAKAEFDDMMVMIEKAAHEGTRIDLVERDLWDRLLRLGLIALGGFVHAQGTGDVGPTFEHEGQSLKRLEDLPIRRYVSILGELLIQRTAYGTRPTQKLEVLPLDCRLGLPASDFSHLLQNWDQSFCVQNAYDPSRQSIQRILGLGQTVGSLETRKASFPGLNRKLRSAIQRVAIRWCVSWMVSVSCGQS